MFQRALSPAGLVFEAACNSLQLQFSHRAGRVVGGGICRSCTDNLSALSSWETEWNKRGLGWTRWQLLRELAAELLRQARECRTGISQAACGIHQNGGQRAGNPTPGEVRKEGFRERISGDQKFEECRNVVGTPGGRDVMYENVWVETFWSALVSYSSQSYVSRPNQAVPLIIKGRRKQSCRSHRYCTPDGNDNKLLPQWTTLLAWWWQKEISCFLIPLPRRGINVLSARCQSARWR